MTTEDEPKVASSNSIYSNAYLKINRNFKKIKNFVGQKVKCEKF